MKLYDKIYVPCTFEEAVNNNRSRTIGLTYHVPVDKAIVLTIEELREVWKAGVKYGFDVDFAEPSPDFEKFLQSKGININEK